MDFLQKLTANGGPFVWLLLVLAVASVAVIIERLYYIHSGMVQSRDFIAGIMNTLRRNEENDNVIEAISLCDHTEGFIPRIVKAAVSNMDKTPEQREKAVRRAALAEQRMMERHVNLLASVAKIANLLGLLGTVSELMKAFEKINKDAAFVNIRALAPAVGNAMMALAVGLTLSVIAYVFYNYIATRIASVLAEIELSSNELLEFIATQEQEDAAPIPAAAD